MLGDAEDPRLAEQVRGLVERELRRLGRREPLHLEGDSLVLGQGATAARTDVSGTVRQWESLPEDLRERRARQIAELLSLAPASAVPEPRAQRLSPRRSRFASIAPLAVVAVTALALWVAYRTLSPSGPGGLPSLLSWFHSPARAPMPEATRDPDQERQHLARHACDLSRVRISRGASIGPSDVEGWEVELVLLRRGVRRDLAADPALSRFVRRESGSTRGTWIWPNASSLIQAQRFDAEVQVQAFTELEPSGLSGLRLVFSGPYVGPYFSDEKRPEYYALADALADALSATDGGLYARCASASAHYIGSWFLGPSPAATVSSLVYFMAAYPDAPILKPELFGNPNQRSSEAFDAIGRASARLDRTTTAELVGGELGMISGRPGHPSRLIFPFRDANRAARASVTAARTLGVARPG